MSSFQRVLILDPAAEPSARRSSDLITDTAANITEALNQLATEGYDAVLCRVDGPDEVSFLLRIKKAAPSVPLIALTPGSNPALDDLARDSGADEVQAKPGLGTAELIARARAAVAQSKEIRAQGRELVAQRRQLIARKRILSHEWTDQVREVFEGFLPLVVEDNPDQVLFLKRAFEKAFLPCPLPVLKDGMEAIDYLSGQGAYSDRATYPLPSLVILDIKMPKKSGLDVIAWIRSRPDFVRLPVFMLTASPDHYDTAMTLGASDYYTKPMESGGLLEILRTIAVRWWFFRQAFEGPAKAPAKKKILVVEDLKSTRDVLAFLFSNRGYDVIPVADGQAALVKARELQPDLIVLDSELPGISGYDVYRDLRRDPALKSIPVLLLVADTEAFDVPTRSIPSAQYLVTKPFKAHDLLARASKILGTK